MRLPRSLAARLIALLLLLQWAGAVLPQMRALAMLGRATAVELCTHSGTRTVLVDENGQPVEASHDSTCCDLCQGPAAIEPAGPQAPDHRVLYLAVAHPAGRAGLPPFPPRAPPQQPRAPPAA
jgi:hypothetical protein